MSYVAPHLELLELLRTRAYRQGTFTLASGATSDFYIDVKQVALTPVGLRHLAAGLCDRLKTLEDPARPLRGVAGVVLGGCALATAVSYHSYECGGPPLDALFVRKEAKAHGTQKLVEAPRGLAADGARPRVALLEDVVTTGGSSLAAIRALRAEGYDVDTLVVVVDRQEGGMEAIAAEGVRASALYARSDFVR